MVYFFHCNGILLSLGRKMECSSVNQLPLLVGSLDPNQLVSLFILNIVMNAKNKYDILEMSKEKKKITT
jgi:hypothetical protein